LTVGAITAAPSSRLIVPGVRSLRVFEYLQGSWHARNKTKSCSICFCYSSSRDLRRAKFVVVSVRFADGMELPETTLGLDKRITSQADWRQGNFRFSDFTGVGEVSLIKRVRPCEAAKRASNTMKTGYDSLRSGVVRTGAGTQELMVTLL